MEFGLMVPKGNSFVEPLSHKSGLPGKISDVGDI